MTHCARNSRYGLTTPFGLVGGSWLNSDMSDLYTKNGRPLQRSGDSLYSRSGHYLGQIRNGKVHDQSGRYAGTIVGDRVVYRGPDSATAGSPSVSARRAGSARANRAGSAIWGDEPPLPD